MKFRVIFWSLMPLLALCVAAESQAEDPAKIADKSAQSIFDGKSLGDWKTTKESVFSDGGTVEVSDGALQIGSGVPYSGVRYTGKVPTMNYEIALEAKRTKGDDFFCGLTFPVGDSPLTLIVGGWGGTVVGLSNIDGMNASENEVTSGMSFENNRWYKIRLRVLPKKIETYIDDHQVIDLNTVDHKFTIYSTMEPMKPLGLTTWNTAAAVRNITIRTLTDSSDKPEKPEKK